MTVFVGNRFQMMFAKGGLQTVAPIRFKARWCEAGGQRFYARSGWEANYAYYLEFLRTKGYIQAWKHEPKVYRFPGVTRGRVSAKPDFLVIENSGEEVLHEVKGYMDDRSRVILKRMKKYYPELKLILIDRDQYASIRTKLGRVIPGWCD